MTDTKQIKFTVWNNPNPDTYERIAQFTLPQPDIYDSDDISFRMKWNYSEENVKQLTEESKKFELESKNIWKVDTEKWPAILTYLTMDHFSITVRWTFVSGR